MKTHLEVSTTLPDLNEVTMHWDKSIELKRSLCGSPVENRTTDMNKVTCKACQKLWRKQ